jgi:hypothetical protein
MDEVQNPSNSDSKMMQITESITRQRVQMKQLFKDFMEIRYHE